ncbi:MAG TPA: response regulator [Candidatus Deferrimicrobiaceae bacterium]|jgi:two-component system chemotaxis response regulator CheY
MTTILIVDDSRTMRKVISNRITETGLRIDKILEAQHGQDALEILSAASVDLVLTDINMPVMNGLDLISRIRDNPAWDALPVLVVSTEGKGPMGKEAIIRGANNLLRKPFTAENIRELLEGYLKVSAR